MEFSRKQKLLEIHKTQWKSGAIIADYVWLLMEIKTSRVTKDNGNQKTTKTARGTDVTMEYGRKLKAWQNEETLLLVMFPRRANE